MGQCQCPDLVLEAVLDDVIASTATMQLQVLQRHDCKLQNVVIECRADVIAVTKAKMAAAVPVGVGKHKQPGCANGWDCGLLCP